MNPLTVVAQFTVFGHRFPPVDLTALLGVSLVLGVVLLIGATTFN